MSPFFQILKFKTTNYIEAVEYNTMSYNIMPPTLHKTNKLSLNFVS